MKLSITLILGLALVGNTTFEQSEKDFCKKWKLSGYVYWGLKFPPEANEKNDYIHFKSDGTFMSKDEGQSEKGTWKWLPKSKAIYCIDKKSKDVLKLEVVEISRTKIGCESQRWERKFDYYF